METPTVRDRASLPQSCKKIEYVAAEEIRAAMLQVARDSFGATCTEIAHGACRLLGFGRVTDDVRVVIDQNRDASWRLEFLNRGAKALLQHPRVVNRRIAGVFSGPGGWPGSIL